MTQELAKVDDTKIDAVVNTVVDILVGTVPFVGGPLNTLMKNYKSGKKTAKILTAIQSLSDRLEECSIKQKKFYRKIR